MEKHPGKEPQYPFGGVWEGLVGHAYGEEKSNR